MNGSYSSIFSAEVLKEGFIATDGARMQIVSPYVISSNGAKISTKLFVKQRKNSKIQSHRLLINVSLPYYHTTTMTNSHIKNKNVQNLVIGVLPKRPGIVSCPIRRMSCRLARRSISPSAFARARFAFRLFGQ